MQSCFTDYKAPLYLSGRLLSAGNSMKNGNLHNILNAAAACSACGEHGSETSNRPLINGLVLTTRVGTTRGLNSERAKVKLRI